MEQPIDIDRDQHAVDVLKQLNSFRQKKKHCDFLIKAGKREIAVHRYVVSACSDYFDAMLSHDTAENRRGVVEIKNVHPGTVLKCVDFMYTGEASVSEDNREQLMHVAHMLQLPKLYNGIALFLEENLDSTSFFSVKKLANLYNCQRLVGVCNEFALQHLWDIVQLQGFGELDKEYVEFLITSKDAKANEMIKFKAVLKWIKQDSSNRKDYLLGFMGNIDLTKIPLTYRNSVAQHEPLIFTSDAFVKKLMTSSLESVNIKPRGSEISTRQGIAVFDKNSQAMQCFDITGKEWKQLQPMKDDMVKQQFSAVAIEQYLYVFVNGVKSYRIQYSDVDATWEELPNRNLNGYGPAVVLKGEIYTSNSFSDNTQSMEKYNSVRNKWTILPNRKEWIYSYAVAVAEGNVLCIGGYSGGNATSRVVKFDPVLSTWSNDSALKTARWSASATTWENGIYVLGGYDQNDVLLGDVEYRSPKSKTWTKLTSMRVVRTFFSAVATDGRIYAIAGDEGNPKTIEEYDPETKQWNIFETLEGKDTVSVASVMA